LFVGNPLTILHPLIGTGCDNAEEGETIHSDCDSSSSSPIVAPTKKRSMKPAKIPGTQKRAQNKSKIPGTQKRAKKQSKLPVAKKVKVATNPGGKKPFTVASVLLAFKDKTEYGSAFRAMSDPDQLSEVERLNKGAVIGMKGAIRKQRIHSEYKDVVAERMQEYVKENRTPDTKMFRTVQPSAVTQRLQVGRLSVGEWVEVDADRTPGWNSEGGIGVIISVQDGLADVKYVFQPSLKSISFLPINSLLRFPDMFLHAALKS
jgi:hypothetical protein